MSEGTLPYMTLSMRVPEVRREVHMMIMGEIDKLKEQIAQTVESAVIKRADTVEGIVEDQLDGILRDQIRDRVYDAAHRMLNDKATHDRIEELVRESIKAQLYPATETEAQ